MSYLVSPFSSNDFKNLLGGDFQNDNIARPRTRVSDVLDFTAPARVVSGALPNTNAIRKGVYADYPAATPKYSTANDDKSLQTQARLLIPLPDEKTYLKFRSSFGGYSADIKTLVDAIAVAGGRPIETAMRPTGYIDFLLTQAQEGFEEKLQVIDVVGDNYVAYFFGQRPPIFSYQGVLMNTKQDDWRLAMLLMYQNVIRGTQLARRNTMVTLAYDKLAVTGALVNMTQILTAELQMAAQFNFQILVKRLDVQRTEQAMPTILHNLPYAVQPDTFATEVFDTPRATMREAMLPSNTTEERKAAKPPTESSIVTTDVHGG
jgi:hypothetical protein